MSDCRSCKYALWDYEEYYGGKRRYFVDDCKWNETTETCEQYEEDEERTEKRTETHECDCISRQAAIDLIAYSSDDLNDNEQNWNMQEEFRKLPSVQPEFATDTNVPNNDCISRQASIDALTHKWDGMVTSVFNVLKELPSVQPDIARDIATIIENEQDMRVISQNAGQWIPVTERLPHGTCSDLVNVSIHDDSGDTPFDYTSCGWVTTDGEYWIVDNEINNHVIAWMPLPEPWRGGQDG